MWELDYIESWAPKNWCSPTVVLEKTLESPLDCKEIKPVSPQGNQAWIFIGRTDAEAQILWPSGGKNWLIGKDPDARKDWRQEEKGMTEDELFGWHRWLDGHEFEPTLGVGDGQGSLVCCSPWGHKDSNMTEWLNWTDRYKDTVLFFKITWYCKSSIFRFKKHDTVLFSKRCFWKLTFIGNLPCDSYLKCFISAKMAEE